MRKVLIALALILSATAYAQNDDKPFSHLAVGLNLGTNGIGFELASPISPIIGVRAGMDFMPMFSITQGIKYDRPEALNNVPQSFLEDRYVNIPENGAKCDVVGKPHLTEGKILFDIYTSKTGSFHFTVGAMIGNSIIAKARAADKTIAAVELYNNDIKNGVVLPEPGYENGITIDMEGYPLGHDKGRAELDLKVNAFRPYIGFGFGRPVPRKRIGCKFDMGVQFWGTPKVIDKYADHEIKKDEPGCTSDLHDAIKIINGIPVYPTIKFSIFGKIF